MGRGVRAPPLLPSLNAPCHMRCPVVRPQTFLYIYIYVCMYIYIYIYIYVYIYAYAYDAYV